MAPLRTNFRTCLSKQDLGLIADEITRLPFKAARTTFHWSLPEILAERHRTNHRGFSKKSFARRDGPGSLLQRRALSTHCLAGTQPISHAAAEVTQVPPSLQPAGNSTKLLSLLMGWREYRQAPRSSSSRAERIPVRCKPPKRRSMAWVNVEDTGSPSAKVFFPLLADAGVAGLPEPPSAPPEKNYLRFPGEPPAISGRSPVEATSALPHAGVGVVGVRFAHPVAQYRLGRKLSSHLGERSRRFSESM